MPRRQKQSQELNAYLIIDSNSAHSVAEMVEHNSFLSPLIEAGFRVSWVDRIAEVDTNAERAEAVARLMPYHEQAVREMGGSVERFWLCEQTHSALVVPVSGESSLVAEADGLCTNDPSAVLGVHVADCGALYIGDPVNQAAAVVHSGKVGTEKNIMAAAVQTMQEEYGSDPAQLIVSLAPCIRPPAYEVDFAAEIKKQAIAAGVTEAHYHDCGICTTSAPETYYSYRLEQGKTGRMIALIALS